MNAVAVINRTELFGTPYEGEWSEVVSKSEVEHLFDGWEPQVKTLIDLMHNPMRWAVNLVPSLPTYVSGRVALLGDAAHAMTPHQGSGAGQATEDGFVLAALLAQPETTTKTLPTALQVYDEIRRPFSQDIQCRSLAAGQLGTLNNAELLDVTEDQSFAGGISLDALKRVDAELEELYDWTWTTSAMDDRDRAVKLLKEKLASKSC